MTILAACGGSKSSPDAAIDAATSVTVKLAGSPQGYTAGDAFAFDKPGIVFGLGANTLLVQGTKVEDMFGGRLGTTEPGDVLFVDSRPAGTAFTVTVQLPAPVAIKRFSVWLNEDTPPIARSCRELKLSADGNLVEDVSILDSSGTQTYDSKYGSSGIEIDVDLVGAPASAKYTLDFIQNAPANPSNSGPRVGEFDAFTD